MKNLLIYIGRVLKWTFSTADGIAKTVGVIALFYVEFKVPQISWQWSLVALAFLIFNGTYRVWREELKSRLQVQTELDEIKDKIPTYAISVTTIKKYSVTDLIEKYEQLINNAKAQPEPKRFKSPFASLLPDTSVISQMYAEESNKSKITRYKEHLSKLVEVEHALECTYFVEFDIQSTKPDSNVHVTLRPEKTALFIEKDDFKTEVVPTTHTPQYFRTTSIYDHRLSIDDIPNIRAERLETYISTAEGYEHFNKINANVPYKLFDNDMHIQWVGDELKLTAEVHSTHRPKPQKIKLKLKVSEQIETIQLDGKR